MSTISAEGDGGKNAGIAGLLPYHADHLRSAAISDEVILARGYRSVSRPSAGDASPRALLQRCGIPGSVRKEDARYPGLLIPLWRATGERISWQYRPDAPGTDPKTGKRQRYVAQAGRPSVLDVHPANRNRIADPTIPLWITEGIKKGDALTTAGACVVTLAGVFSWRRTHGTLGDWEDIPLKGRRVNVCFDADARTNPNVARAMARLGHWLRSKGAAEISYITVPAKVGDTEVKGADDYLAAGGTLGGLLAAAQRTPPEAAEEQIELSDAELAGDLADELLDGLYCWSRGLGWMGWDGRRWRETSDEDVREKVRLWALGKHEAALEAVKAAARAGTDAKRHQAKAAAWHKYLARARIEAITALSQGIMLRDATDFDAHPDLLNVANGIVDLRTGELLPHDPALLMTKLAPAAYDPAARHPDWDKALQAIPDENRGWAQLRYGQAITGHPPPDDLLIVQTGTGENGKTTIVAGIQATIGDYQTLVSRRALLGDARTHSTELMDFRGARLAVLEETPEEGRIDVTSLKEVVGTPQITARKLYQNNVTFEVSHTLFVNTNYLPLVEQTDHGSWRRLACLKYPFRFLKPHEVARGHNDRPGDPGLRDRVREGADGQHEAILAWLIQGAWRWYGANKIMPAVPAAVEADTRAWRKNSDLILAYLDDKIVFDTSAHVPVEELHADFSEWAVARGQRAWSLRTFGERFDGHAEIAANHVEKIRTRHRAGLSRRPSLGWDPPAITGMYRGLLGIRFRTSQDPLPEEGADADQPERGSVPGVPGLREPPRTRAESENFPETRHTRHKIVCGRCREPLDQVLVNAGDTTHPNCDPAFAGISGGAWDGFDGE